MTIPKGTRLADTPQGQGAEQVKRWPKLLLFMPPELKSRLWAAARKRKVPMAEVCRRGIEAEVRRIERGAEDS